MNLQALITTPLPSQFLAILYLWLLLCLCMCNCLILFWKDFTSLAGFYTILLICPDCYLSQFPVCAFYFVLFANLTSYTFFFSFSWDALFFCPWQELLKFLHTLPWGFCIQVTLLTQSFHCSCLVSLALSNGLEACPSALDIPWIALLSDLFLLPPTSVCVIGRCIDGSFFFF